MTVFCDPWWSVVSGHGVTACSIILGFTGSHSSKWKPGFYNQMLARKVTKCSLYPIRLHFLLFHSNLNEPNVFREISWNDPFIVCSDITDMMYLLLTKYLVRNTKLIYFVNMMFVKNIMSYILSILTWNLHRWHCIWNKTHWYYFFKSTCYNTSNTSISIWNTGI